MRTRFPLVAALFLVSGATGLLYEVAFSKQLAYVFGATAYAVSTVLAAFMGGLALGAHLGGRFGSRARRPLAAYGGLEIAVGLICAATPAAFSALTGAYVALARSAPQSLALLTVARAALTGLVVVVPTVAMGATLPLLSRVVAGAGAREHGARRLSVLYAINTVGGALGALAGAYAVLPALGVRGTMYGAALTNMAIGVVAIAIGLRAPAAPNAAAPERAAGRDAAEGDAASAPDDHADEPPDEHDGRALLALALLSGFLVFAAEVVETHLLALLIGNSAYAFGLMLAVFLVCLAIGAARTPVFAGRHGAAAVARGLSWSALWLALTLPLWDQLPRFFVFAGLHVTSWGGRELCRAVAAIAILAVPTVWMGSTFPLLLQRVAGRRDVAARVGRLTVANTLGTIVGSIVTGYAILPTLGSQRALGAVAAAFGAAAIYASRLLPTTSDAEKARREQRRALALGAVAAVLAFAMPRWDLARLTNGANVYFTHGPPPEAIEMVREDVHGGVTTVTRRGDVRTMYTNGKFQGDDGGEMTAQRRFAHFPSLFVERRDRALVIGLGTGTTLGTIASYPWKHVDVAEISPAIVEAARTYFAGPSFSSLDDPRVHLDVNDGRNLLLVSTEPYDLITMELSSVWFAGASSLYSREFYELTKARLRPDGVLQQWVQLHHMRERELAVIIHTLRAVYPHVALFVGGGQGILVAASRPLVASRARLSELEVRPEIARTLNGATLNTMFDELLASEEDLDRFIAAVEQKSGPVPPSTDDNLYLEYATPKANVMNYDASLREMLGTLERFRTADPRARHLGP